MRAFGWITLGHRLLAASFLRRRTPRKTRKFASAPGLESLEAMQLLSALVPHPLARPAAQVAAMPAAQRVAAAAVSQTTQLQTATVPSTLTNFTLPFTPPVALFNPALGTLNDVKVTAIASLRSNIVSENTSSTSEAAITGFTNGQFTIAGIGPAVSGSLNGTTQTVTVPPFSPPGGTPNFTGPSTVNFDPLMVTGPPNPTRVFTSPSDLQFFTASAGRTSISPTLTESAQSGANAANGNLLTLVRTQGSGVLTVTYDYTPACPAVTKIVRFGIHHQPTRIQITFDGPVPDPAQASDPAFYTITAPNAQGSFTGPGTTTVPVSSAVYDATNHTVLLTTAKQLNVHYLFQLGVNLPCYNGNPTLIEFGSKMSLGGFTNHVGQFVPVVGGEAVTAHGLRPLPPGNTRPRH